MAHNLANTAMAEALKGVEAAFKALELEPNAIVINVVYAQDNVQWAAGSHPPKEMDHATREMLLCSLRTSGEELTENE